MGYVTPLGGDVQQGLETAGGPCGQVWLKKGTYMPKASKIASAVLPAGAIKMRATVAPRALRERQPRSKWIDVQKDDLEVLRQHVEEDVRYAYRVVGPVISGAPAMMTTKNDYMALSALLGRMFAMAPAPQPGIWDWAARFISVLWPHFEEPPEELSQDDWLASMPAKRRRALTEAMQMYRETGWRKRYAKFKSFLKDEPLPGFMKKDGALFPLERQIARLINAPNDVTHCIAGPKIKPYMGWLKKQWHKDNFLFYGSTGPDKLQAWLEMFSTMGPRFYFWSDYSMYDASHNDQSWKFVEAFYAQHKHDADFQRVLDSWRAPKGTLGNFKYTGRIMNASGRDDTALANALLNGTAMFLSVTAAWCNKSLAEVSLADTHEVASLLKLSVCGDDALGSLPLIDQERAEKFLKDSKANIETFGFSAKMFGSYNLEDCVYLGHRPYPVAGKWYWGKTLGRALYKLGYQSKVTGDGFAHFKGICKMHDVCSRHVPVLSDLTLAWDAATEGGKVTAWEPDPNKPWELMGTFGPRSYDESTIASVARAYTVSKTSIRGDLEGTLQDVKVTVEDVKELIEYVKTVRGQPCVLDHWLLRHMVVVDEQ